MAASLKARLPRVLLDRGASAVVFADTDSSFYGAIDDLAQPGPERGIVLFPHSTRPVRVRRYFPASQLEYGRLTNGLFNTGLYVSGPGGRSFLDWWDGWLARDCLKEQAAGLWADQVWADWAPVYFEHAVVRDPSVNVAFWNLDERELREVDGRPTVDGVPLRHFHFAGFDPRRPDIRLLDLRARRVAAAEPGPHSPAEGVRRPTAHVWRRRAPQAPLRVRRQRRRSPPRAHERAATGRPSSLPKRAGRIRPRTRSMPPGSTSSSTWWGIRPHCVRSRRRRSRGSRASARRACRAPPSPAPPDDFPRHSATPRRNSLFRVGTSPPHRERRGPSGVLTGPVEA